MTRDKCLQPYLTWCHKAEKTGSVRQVSKHGSRQLEQDMSSRMKYGSAFTPVKSPKSILNHPFSITNLLNLDSEPKISEKERTQGSSSIQNSSNVPSINPLRFEDSTAGASSGPFPTSLFQTQTFSPNPQWPAWVYATRYSRYGIPQANYGNARRPRKPTKKQKQRPLFSQTQLQRMEEEFTNEKYISKSRRCKLASEVNLTEAQVRTWFQNRRTRWRKEVHGEGSICREQHGWVAYPLREFRSSNQSQSISNCVVVRGYCSS